MTLLNLPRPMRALLLGPLLALSAFAAVIASADAAPSEARAAAAAPSAAAAASTAHAAVRAYLALWSGDTRAGEASVFSDDLVLRYAHSNPELRGEVRGRSSVVTQTRAVARLGRAWQFRDLRLFPTLHANVYFAQYTATATSAVDGSAVERNVVLAVELDGPRAVRIVEFANPAIALAGDGPASVSAAR